MLTGDRNNEINYNLRTLTRKINKNAQKEMKENAITKRIPPAVQNPKVGLFEECVYHTQERNP